MRSSRPEDFCDVFERLKSADVPYVVVGGVAVALHGTARPVTDLDIAVSADPKHASRTMQAMSMSGFVATVPLPLNLVTILRMFDATGREVDLIVRPVVPFNELWPDSIEIPVGNTRARVASLEHLVRGKKITARPEDLEDVESLNEINNPTPPDR